MSLLLENLRIKFSPENILDMLKDIWYTIKKLPKFIVKVFQYAKVLWRDCDYDYASILILLKYKIQRTREHIIKHDIIADAPIIAKQMRYAEFLIQRILDDDYLLDLQQQHDEKWGVTISHFDESNRFHIVKEKSTTPELQKQERSEQMVIYDAQENVRQKDLDRLFRHLRRYIQRWWD